MTVRGEREGAGRGACDASRTPSSSMREGRRAEGKVASRQAGKVAPILEWRRHYYHHHHHHRRRHRRHHHQQHHWQQHQHQRRARTPSASGRTSRTATRGRGGGEQQRRPARWLADAHKTNRGGSVCEGRSGGVTRRTKSVPRGRGQRGIPSPVPPWWSPALGGGG